MAFVQAGPVINTIVYPDTLKWVKEVTGQRFRPPAEDAPRSTLQPGDAAMVIRRVTRRAQEWKQPFDPAVMELGISCAARCRRQHRRRAGDPAAHEAGPRPEADVRAGTPALTGSGRLPRVGARDDRP